MNSPKASPTIAQRSLRLRRMLTGLVWTLGLVVLLERFSAAGLALWRHGFAGEDLRRLALAGLKAFPEALYLLALWWVRQALGSFAAGELYAAAVSRMLERVGFTLALSAFFAVFVLPGASTALGFPPGYFIALDVASLVLGAVGLSLTVIAHVLRTAAEQKAELEEIF